MSSHRLQRELHNRDRTIEVLRQTIRLMKHESDTCSEGNNNNERSQAETYDDDVNDVQDDLQENEKNEKNSNSLDGDSTERKKQISAEFRQKFTQFQQRHSVLPHANLGNTAAVAVVQPRRKRSKSVSSLNDFDDLDQVKAGSKRFNELVESSDSQRSLLSSNSSIISSGKELLDHSFPTQVQNTESLHNLNSSTRSSKKEFLLDRSFPPQAHDIEPSRNLSEKKKPFKSWQQHRGKVTDSLHEQAMIDYKLYDMLENNILVAVRLVRHPSEELGLELAQVTETRPPKNSKGSGGEKIDVMYVIHGEDGENVVLNESESPSTESRLGSWPISDRPNPRSHSVSFELDLRDDNSTNRAKSSSRADSKPSSNLIEDLVYQERKHNLVTRLNLSLPSSPLPSRSNSADINRPLQQTSSLPQRPSSALAHWRSAGSPPPRPGVRIVGVAEGSVAAQNGLQDDDVIVEVRVHRSVVLCCWFASSLVKQ